MQTDHLSKAFKQIGVDFQCRTTPRPRFARSNFVDDGISINTRGNKLSPFTLTVGKDAHGEINVLNVNPDEKGILIQIKQDDTKASFLCGLDEMDHTFIARVANHGVTNVFSAKEALKPAAVREAERKAPKMGKKKNKHKRRNAARLRQGEWFFVPSPDFDPDNKYSIRKNAPLIRGSSRAHRAQFAVDVAGETRYFHRNDNRSISEKQFQRLVKGNPDERVMWEVRSLSSFIFVKGKITAPDHKTLNLKVWHRAIPNEELSLTTGRIASTFYD